MKIFLIGMPGSGKTTLGRELADALSLPFIDLDHEIENQEGIPVKEIFSARGEKYFREVESATLKTLATSTHDFVLATGGGAPCFHDGINIINASGISIFLDIAIDELIRRVENNTDRPLLNVDQSTEDKAAQLRERLEKIRRERLSVYRQATFTESNPVVEDLVNKIKSKAGIRN